MSLTWKPGLIFLASEILLTLTRRYRSKTGTKQDRSTLGTIWLVTAVSVAATAFVAQNFAATVLPAWRGGRNGGVGVVCRGINSALAGDHHARSIARLSLAREVC